MSEYFYKDARSDNVVSIQFLSEKGYVTKLTGSQASRFVAQSLYWKRALEIPESDFEIMAELHASRKGRRRRKDPVARHMTILFKRGWDINQGLDWGDLSNWSRSDPPQWALVNSQPKRFDTVQLLPPRFFKGELSWDGCGTDWRVVSYWAIDVEVIDSAPRALEEHFHDGCASRIDLDELFYLEDPFSREVTAVKWNAWESRLSLAELKKLVARTNSWGAAKAISKEAFLKNFKETYTNGRLRHFPVVVIESHNDPNFEIKIDTICDEDIVVKDSADSDAAD